MRGGCIERGPQPGLTRSKYRQGVKSFRALQTKDDHDDKQWLTFWLLYPLFDLACFVGDMVGWILPVPCPASLRPCMQTASPYPVHVRLTAAVLRRRS